MIVIVSNELSHFIFNFHFIFIMQFHKKIENIYLFIYFVEKPLKISYLQNLIWASKQRN